MNEPRFMSKPRCNALERVGMQSAEELVEIRTAKRHTPCIHQHFIAWMRYRTED